MARLFGRVGSPKGIYEYVIARTRFMDAQFQAALEDRFDQIVILGAGFDSRAQRFSGLNQGTVIFEVDAPITQAEKQKALAAKRILTPPELVFVPLDLNRQSLAQALTEAGYRPGLKTLFLLEGLIMYLTDRAVEDNFAFFSETSGPGGRIAFDYVLAEAIADPSDYFGAEAIINRVTKAGEPWRYFLDRSGLENLLRAHRFRLLESASAEELEKRWFSDHRGRARVNQTHALAVGEKI